MEECKNALVLDVRSPGEYSHAHLPGAISLPLFTDEERKVVGTAYKQVSRQNAIKIGLDYFGPKMRGMVEKVEELAGNRQLAVGTNLLPDATANRPVTAHHIFLYCWRGGMRSGAVAWLLNLYGFNVTVLNGGYKAFRNWVLKANDFSYPLQIIGGYTGSGKTMLLKELELKGEAVLNLEELASHKGSAFGNLGMPAQPSQEMFENLLAIKSQLLYREMNSASTATADTPISRPQKRIWIEDESQRIGQVNIPHTFWQNMRQSPICFIDVPFEERLDNLVGEYGSLDRERMIAAIERISKRLGPLETKLAIQHLQEENTKESFRILLHYYDKRYNKGLQNRDNLDLLLTKVSCESVSVGNAALVSQAQQVTTYAGTN